MLLQRIARKQELCACTALQVTESQSSSRTAPVIYVTKFTVRGVNSLAQIYRLLPAEYKLPIPDYRLRVTSRAGSPLGPD